MKSITRQLEALLDALDPDRFDVVQLRLDPRSCQQLLHESEFAFNWDERKRQRTWNGIPIFVEAWLPPVPLELIDVPLRDVAIEEYRQVTVECYRRDNDRPAFFTSPESHDMWKKQGLEE